MASLWFYDVVHGRSQIADAVADQLPTLAAFHSFDRFTNEPAERLADEVDDDRSRRRELRDRALG